MVKPLPCPLCGRMPVFYKYRYRSMKPSFSCKHAPSDGCTLCTADVESDLYREFDHPSEAIRDWNLYAIALNDRNWEDPWMPC